jgi:SPOR domain
LLQIYFIMNRLKYKQIIIVFFVAFFWSNNIYGQTIETSPKIDALLKEKRKAATGITINDAFKIQIYFGDLESSKTNLANFKITFPLIDATLIYRNPSYKVVVGSYDNKIEADKALKTIKKKFTSATIINPNK